MKIYLDIVFLLNFIFDFILLVTVSILLKRKASLKRIALGALIGAITIFCLFIELTSIQLFLIKFIMSILMIITTFSFKNIKYFLKNMSYLYMSSIILGGFMYYLNIEFSYKQEGLIFYHHGLSINFIFLVIFSPIILYNYVKQERDIKKIKEYYHSVKIYIKNSIYNCNGYIDTGNNLVDPYFHKPIIIVNPKIINENEIKKIIYVPVSTVTSKQNMKCFFPDKIEIDGLEVKKKILLGISNKKIELDGVDILLQTEIMEG